MEFTQEQIDAFLEEFRDETNATFKDYQDACIKFDVAPMDYSLFTTACMTIIEKAPYLREKAEMYKEMDENAGVISQDDNLPPTLFYELHYTSYGNIYMAASFVDDGYEIQIIPMDQEELDGAFVRLIDVAEIKQPEEGNEDAR